MSSELEPPRGQVTREQRRCLEKHRDFLFLELDSNCILPLLRRDGILDASDEENIRSRTTRMEQNRQLLDIVANRTSAGFLAFMQTLDETRHENAARTLRETLDDCESAADLDSMDQAADQVSQAESCSFSSSEEITRLETALQEAYEIIEQLKEENAQLVVKAELLQKAEEKINALEEQICHLYTENTNLELSLQELKAEVNQVKTNAKAEKRSFETKLRMVQRERESDKLAFERSMVKVNGMLHNMQDQITEMGNKLDDKVDKEQLKQELGAPKRVAVLGKGAVTGSSKMLLPREVTRVTRALPKPAARGWKYGQGNNGQIPRNEKL